MATTQTKIVRTTTNQLQIGDVIQHGNIFDGFTFTTVNALNRSTHSNMIEVLEQFNHGGVGGTWYGKNAIWYVVKEAN
jgi:hypothetical protein